MEILRYEVPKDIVGTEGEMAFVLRQAVHHDKDVVVDRESFPLPRITVKSYAPEMNSLITTIAVERLGLKRVFRKTPS